MAAALGEENWAYDVVGGWIHWISTALSISCLLIGWGELTLRYPVLIVWWLLANAALAAVRRFRYPPGPTERLLLTVLLWVVGLVSVPLLVWASFANDDVVFRDATTTIRHYQTFSWGGPKEEELVTRHYRKTYLLFEEQVGQAEIEPARPYK